MSISTRILLNAVTNWLATAVHAGVGVILVPFLISQLGREGYGLIGLVGVIASFNMVADLGFSNALARQLAEQIVRQDERRFNELASTAMVYYLSAGLAIALICVVGTPWIVKIFNVSAALMPQAIFLVRWYSSLSALITLASTVFNGVITSNNRFDLKNAINISAGLLQALLLFLVLGLTNSGVVGWAVVLLVVQAGQLPVLWRVAKKLYPRLRIHFSQFRANALRELFSIGGYLFLLNLASLFSKKADPIVLTTFLGPSAVALYTPALSLVNLARPVISTLSQQLHPLATGFHTKGERENLHSVLVRGTRYTFLMGTGACVLLGFFAEPITRIWLGNVLGSDYLVVAWVLILWVIVELSAYTAGSQWPVLLGMNRLRFLTWSQVVPAILNVGFSIWLVGYTNLGVAGVVLPTAVVGLIRRPILIAYTARVCKLPMRTYLKEAYLSPSMALIGLSAVALVLLWIFPPDSILKLTISAAGLGIAWIIMVWFVGFTDEDRDSFGKILERLTSRYGIGKRTS